MADVMYYILLGVALVATFGAGFVVAQSNARRRVRAMQREADSLKQQLALAESGRQYLRNTLDMMLSIPAIKRHVQAVYTP